jgi:sulfur relay (sulfurtransferase) complex TusBCD TusD component (DsrE family)
MRRGCISLGEVKCHKCNKEIPIYARYLVVEEADETEAEKGKPVNYCVNCALKKGYAVYKEEKGEKNLTFFS